MNLTPIATCEFDPDYKDELKHDARRLERVFKADLDVIEVIALIEIIQVYSFEFTDGYIMNPLGDENSVLSASAVAGCLASAEVGVQSAVWWNRRFLNTPRNSLEYRDNYHRILGRIVSSPLIDRTE